MSVESVAVVVPVADEAELLPRCLRALRAARQHLLDVRSVPTAIITVLDACTDGSAAVVAGFPEVEAVHVSTRRVGSARRAGCDHALRNVVHTERCWLAATDADSEVPVDWLTEMVGFADRGADLVLGTVVPVGDHLPDDAMATYYEGYDHRDGHPHVHGANLGIRASTYRRLDGWPDLATGEDHALVATAITAGDVRIRRSGAVPVATSTRLIARAPYGYSSHLRGLIAATRGSAQRGSAPVRVSSSATSASLRFDC